MLTTYSPNLVTEIGVYLVSILSQILGGVAVTVATAAATSKTPTIGFEKKMHYLNTRVVDYF